MYPPFWLRRGVRGAADGFQEYGHVLGDDQREAMGQAEDIVQDVWLRWRSTNRSVIINPSAYLATTTTRLCINAATCARVRRETYVGPWLPEPVDTSADPRLGAERDEALKLAVLVLLEKLSPTERAAYVFREAFDYAYCQIAEILRTEEANVRQLICRARKHVAEGRHTTVSSAEQGRLLDAFFSTPRGGEIWLLWKVSSRKMLSPTPMAEEWYAQRGSPSSAGSE